MKKATLVFLILASCFSFLQAQNIYTVAGDSTQGYFGDGGDATVSELNWPLGVAIDVSGILSLKYKP